jgi:NAD(P)-dependent dehydrogenase (short-subunit alcohol dehydrogenase family)
MVNNAGIGVGGEARELLLAHWDRAIDVNLRGVVHGVHAAYPVMVEQGSGHIVNTASLAGLLPSPGLTPYAMTKHGVVGLSLSLRVEAAAYGVRVTAVCPGVVDTPILDKGGPEDLPRPALVGHAREFFRHYQPRFYSADRLAQDIVRGIDRNAALVVAPASARAARYLWRYAPLVVTRMAARQMAWARAAFPAGSADPAAPRRSRCPPSEGTASAAGDRRDHRWRVTASWRHHTRRSPGLGRRYPVLAATAAAEPPPARAVRARRRSA